MSSGESDRWFELRPGPAIASRLKALGRLEADHDSLAHKKRGHLLGIQSLRFEWTGMAEPPAFLPIGPTAEILAKRVLDRLKSGGVKGLGYLHASIAQPDGTGADYSLFVVENEVSSICFRRSEKSVKDDERLFVLRDPVIEGLDASVSDAFVLPYELAMHTVIVSTRFTEIARYSGLTNVEFRPIEKLELTRPNPEQVLC